MNSTILSGNLVATPILKSNDNGHSYTYFTIAVYRNKDVTYFIDCVAFDKLAEYLCEAGSKGARVELTGMLEVKPIKDSKYAKEAKVIVSTATVLAKK